MALVSEQALINQLATEFDDNISGIGNAFGFAQNPDTLANAKLPAIVFIPLAFASQAKAHHNVHRNEIEIAGALFVSERAGRGGTLRFLENATMPYLFKVRKHFQQEDTVNRLLALGLTQATLLSGNYGAGGTFLTYGGVEYIGIVFRWNFIEIN